MKTIPANSNTGASSVPTFRIWFTCNELRNPILPEAIKFIDKHIKVIMNDGGNIAWSTVLNSLINSLLETF